MTESAIRETLVAILADVAPTIEIGADDFDKPLDDLGFDSLDESGLLLGIEEHYSMKISAEDSEKLTTLNDYVTYISGRL